ncbi:hypothetical protein [Telluria beijingensis]|uniref:hypothetical protein n=1 Tax=Telluria beijingensis TaxID=3068633 RepID=UPI0027960506|nr:hypothetical protein [Massilia sp. REN29]
MASIKQAIETNDPKNEKFEQIKTTLDLLDKLATLKLGELNEQIRKELDDDSKFRITHQDQSKSGTHVTASDDADNIGRALDNIVDGFCAGSSDGSKKAVAGIVSTALTALLGSGAGQETYQQSFAAIAEDDILKRIDVAFWSYGVAAGGITEKSQTPIAYVCVKSYIDPGDVHATELVSMYRAAARLAKKPEDEKNILQALEEAQKVLAAMKDDPVMARDNHLAALSARRMLA